MVLAPVLGKMEAGCLVLWSAEGRLSWQGCVYDQMAGNVVELQGSSCPQRETFLSSTWDVNLTSKNHFSPSQSQRKGSTAGPRSTAATPGLPFPLTNSRAPVKMLVFQTQNNKNKSQSPKQTISLEISVGEMSQSQRHSPGTIPALRGSLHLPFYKKTRKQNKVIFSVFSTGATEKRQEASNYRSLTTLIRFLLNTRRVLDRSSLTEALWNRSLAFPQGFSPRWLGPGDHGGRGQGSRLLL